METDSPRVSSGSGSGVFLEEGPVDFFLRLATKSQQYNTYWPIHFITLVAVV